MEARIPNGKDNFLYCKVDCQVSNYKDGYDSSEEAYNDCKQDIIDDCNERGYDEDEILKVLSYYEILFNNADGNWKNKY